MLTWDYEPLMIREHLKAFEGSFGHTVDLSIIPYTGYTAAIQARFRQGESFDVYYNFASNANRFVENGWAEPLDGLPDADKVVADMFPNVRSHYLNAKGQLVSLPYFSAVHATFYNREHLKTAGIVDFPSTFEDLYEQCKRLKATGTCDTPYTSYWTKQNIEQAFVNYLLAAGTIPFDRRGEPVFADDPRSVTMMEWWLAMYRDNMTQATILTDTIDQVAPLMADGKFTFLQSQHYWLKSIRNHMGRESNNVVMSYRMPGNVNAALQIGEVLQLGKSSQTAWDLAKFYGWRNPINGEFSTLRSWAKAASLAAPYPAFFQDPIVRSHYGEYFDLDQLQGLFAHHSDPVAARNLPWYPDFKADVGNRVHAMLRGDTTPVATIKALAADARIRAGAKS
jgi:multiple sugar transport system substrate-binding protein